MTKNGDRGEELLGEDKGRVKLSGPQERFVQTLKGVGERSKDLGSVSEKSPVEIYHTEKTLQSRFIRGRRKLCDGGGILGERAETGTGEMVSQELSLQNSKFTFAQAVSSAQVQDILDTVMDLMANCASACANHTLAASGQNTGSLRATFAATTGTGGGGRRSALETPTSSGVSSTLVMSDKISLVRANIFPK